VATKFFGAPEIEMTFKEWMIVASAVRGAASLLCPPPRIATARQRAEKRVMAETLQRIAGGATSGFPVTMSVNGEGLAKTINNWTSTKNINGWGRDS